MKNKKIFFTIFILLLSIIVIFTFVNYSLSADQKLVNTMKKAFEQIQDWLIKLATPAAAVAVRCGSFYEKI